MKHKFIQKKRGKGKTLVFCNKCRKQTAIKIKHKKIGDIEYTYMVCQFCKNIYVISVTDSELRQDIKRFEEMTAMESMNGEQQHEAQALLNANVARNRKLKELYPLEL